MELRNYETVFILTPVLSNEEIQETIAKYKTFLVEKKAEIIYEETIGLKKLAYPIQNKKTGVYHLIEFKAAPTIIHDLEVTYRQDEKVLRFLTCILNKYGMLYNQKQREEKVLQSNNIQKEIEV